MGLLVEGKWHQKWEDGRIRDGRFVRSQSQFRDWVTADGSPAPGRERGFKAEPGRYHLYVSYACPWAHRTLIFRVLKKLEDAISVSVVDYFMGDDGWTFVERDGATGDPLYGSDFLHQIYTRADPHYSGRVTVPVLWDKKQETIVSNESSEIIRMFNSAFDEWGDASRDFYPAELRSDIDRWNDRIYEAVNNGVYKCGFARSQEAYEEAFAALFEALGEVEAQLARSRYLVGDRLTEADWRLFTTLARFDPVYVGHFKCNLRRIADYQNLSNYLRELYQVPGIAETVNMFHIKQHYYGSHESVNPTRIVPVGPEIDYTRPHDRDRFRAAA
ncbi:glutathione S-transferase family protein [Nitratireductor mangrovi]|uniref:Glutathione S-transferase family protein n=1 Tax=Nitratireductor mangrovi TaxID=2599600 RepID=A0A5B8L247_9HYPH|nr:glutathione S-transferase family protein [Nitratireductor mangrovi]QDZ02087.1 glutathione S-transferase family protein [Nitratireductor mangrovi]